MIDSNVFKTSFFHSTHILLWIWPNYSGYFDKVPECLLCRLRYCWKIGQNGASLCSCMWIHHPIGKLYLFIASTTKQTVLCKIFLLKFLKNNTKSKEAQLARKWKSFYLSLLEQFKKRVTSTEISCLSIKTNYSETNNECSQSQRLFDYYECSEWCWNVLSFCLWAAYDFCFSLALFLQTAAACANLNEISNKDVYEHRIRFICRTAH